MVVYSYVGSCLDGFIFQSIVCINTAKQLSDIFLTLKDVEVNGSDAYTHSYADNPRCKLE